MSEDSTARLYGLPLEEFTSARNELAAALVKDGDAEAARAVKALKKPSVAAWAVNQLARRNAGEISELLDQRERLEGASGAELRAASQERRKLLAKLVKSAGKILTEAGHGASPATLEKVTQTLQAGASGDEERLLRAGTLTRELAPSGFAGLVVPDAMVSAPPPPSKATERAKKKAEDLAEAARAKDEEARTLERAAEVARKHAEAAARQAETARRNADRARDRAEAAAAALE